MFLKFISRLENWVYWGYLFVLKFYCVIILEEKNNLYRKEFRLGVKSFYRLGEKG